MSDRRPAADRSLELPMAMAGPATVKTICPYCGVGCTLELHVQDNRIVKVTSPADHDVTYGNLCIKGRFGWQFVQLMPEEEADERRRRR